MSKSGKSPAELLFNRKVSNLLPNVSKFQPDCDYKQELYKRQVKQKNYYDQHVRVLPDIEEGKVVKIKEERCSGPHISGVVVGHGKGPRSYHVKTEDGGVVIRNRKDHLDEEIGQEQSRDDSMIESQENNTNDNNIVNNFNDDSMYRTRYGRHVKTPAYLSNYVK